MMHGMNRAWLMAPVTVNRTRAIRTVRLARLELAHSPLRRPNLPDETERWLREPYYLSAPDPPAPSAYAARHHCRGDASCRGHSAGADFGGSGGAGTETATAAPIFQNHFDFGHGMLIEQVTRRTGYSRGITLAHAEMAKTVSPAARWRRRSADEWFTGTRAGCAGDPNRQPPPIAAPALYSRQRRSPSGSAGGGIIRTWKPTL